MKLDNYDPKTNHDRNYVHEKDMFKKSTFVFTKLQTVKNEIKNFHRR